MRIVFMGTPEFAVPSLQALYDQGHDVAGVFCQPDRPKGRGNKVEFCPVKQLAITHGTPVFQPQRIRLDGAEALAALQPDLCVTAAFGQILSEENLRAPKLGTVNVHASLLPRYRGSAPINWAIIHGETVTGVTTMMTDKGMDTGDILLQREIPIPQDVTAGELTVTLSGLGADLLKETLGLIEAGRCPRTPQDHAVATYDPMLKKEMGHLDVRKSAVELNNLVRGVNPWPGAYLTLDDGQTLKVWRAQPVTSVLEGKPGDYISADSREGLVIRTGGDSALRVLEMQMPGGKRMAPQDFFRGHTLPPIDDKELS